ncbi:MAG: His-Xaa-Ser system protein HxsD [Elusimicrobia bacterium GWF2_62_30]|nr:MAG: His-Xaa-Ser system protein HxsD [Elusimicrobia bacterium GWF2_62_30]
MDKMNKSVFNLNLDTYSLESVYQAAYSMLDKLYFYFDKRNAKTLMVEIKSKENLPMPALEKLKGEFLNELLNSELRVSVAKRTRKVREALIAQALIGASADKADYIEDPLGIALPWEEKYGDKEKPQKDKLKKAKH